MKKAETAFHKKLNKKCSTCSDCINKYNREHYKRNPGATKERTKAYRKRKYFDKKVFLIYVYDGMVQRSKKSGFGLCERKAFYKFALNDNKFVELYGDWVNNGHQVRSVPSIDRINCNKGYSLDNIQFLTFHQNRMKGFLEAFE